MNPDNIDRIILSFDGMPPADRHDVLCGYLATPALQTPAHSHEAARYKRELGKKLLIALYAIDEVVRNRTRHAYFFYILDDRSVFRALTESARHAHWTLDDCILACVRLGVSQLIYRFNVARKFAIDEIAQTKQLRLNSWGRDHIAQEDLLHTFRAQYEDIRSWFDDYLTQNESVYVELCRLLLSRIDNDTADRIRQLNRGLAVKLLS